MSSSFQVTLELIGSVPQGWRFRIAFDGSTSRWLLPYPKVTGLQFHPHNGGSVPDWGTSRMVTEPRNEFVLNPDDRIAFDLLACVNGSSQDCRWTIMVPPAEYDIRYVFKVDPLEARYDYLGKGSLFADQTPPWFGVVESNTLRASL